MLKSDLADGSGMVNMQHCLTNRCEIALRPAFEESQHRINVTSVMFLKVEFLIS